MRHTDLPQGRVRSRCLGDAREGVPPVVLVMGMAVANYLMPGLAELARWTRTYLLELPGYAGSGEPTESLGMREYGEVVAAWLDAAQLGPVVLAGHSSGTQVAAHAAGLCPESVAALVLASPTIDPKARAWPRLVLFWLLDGRYPTPGLNDSHKPEWRRAGLRGLLHIARAALRDRLEDSVRELEMPVLVLRGAQDRLLSVGWARHLAGSAPDGRFAELAGPHSFPWVAPDAWSGPIRALAEEVARR